MNPIVEAIGSYLVDFCCRHNWHSYVFSWGDTVHHGTLWEIPIESRIYIRTCKNCDKQQEMHWFVWRDIHIIPPAKLLAEATLKSSS